MHHRFTVDHRCCFSGFKLIPSLSKPLDSSDLLMFRFSGCWVVWRTIQACLSLPVSFPGSVQVRNFSMLRAKALFGQHCVGPEPQLGPNQRDAIACALPVHCLCCCLPMGQCWANAEVLVSSWSTHWLCLAEGASPGRIANIHHGAVLNFEESYSAQQWMWFASSVPILHYDTMVPLQPLLQFFLNRNVATGRTDCQFCRQPWAKNGVRRGTSAVPHGLPHATICLDRSRQLSCLITVGAGLRTPSFDLHWLLSLHLTCRISLDRPGRLQYWVCREPARRELGISSRQNSVICDGVQAQCKHSASTVQLHLRTSWYIMGTQQQRAIELDVATSQFILQ